MTHSDLPSRTHANTEPSAPNTLSVGVVGVGAMGTNHARIYHELHGVDLVGVTDHDRGRARTVATRYGTSAQTLDGLLARCDAVSVAVPTAAHYETVKRCLDAGVAVLVEKPITADPASGRELAERARESGIVLQVGHVERFNPAVETLASMIDDLEVIAVDAARLGPPVDRTGSDGVVLDLMIHDVDVVQSLLDGEPTAVCANRTADGQHATATVEFGDVISTFTASRITQRKVRTLAVTAADCLIEVDYRDQSIAVYRDSYPEFVDTDAVRYRHESVIERPEVQSREPLRTELEAFVSAVRNDEEPPVTPAAGLSALRTVRAIDRQATADDAVEVRGT